MRGRGVDGPLSGQPSAAGTLPRRTARRSAVGTAYVGAAGVAPLGRAAPADSRRSQRRPNKACPGRLWALFRYQTPLQLWAAIKTKDPQRRETPKDIPGSQRPLVLQAPGST